MNEDLTDFKALVDNEFKVQLINKRIVNYINFDNAASTPPFKSVLNKVNEFSKFYSSVHRGSGLKSILCTEIYEEARKVVGDFVGANTDSNSIIFVKNSTEAINKLANCYPFNYGDIIVCSRMEHHSNDLPWRNKAIMKYINVKENGELDLEHYKYILNEYRDKIRLVVITGASNVTGYINPVNYMAGLAHNIGAKILVDASQLAPHEKIDIKEDDNLEHIDFIVFTAHKMYAPFGIGVLIGLKEFFNEVEPDTLGGGIVKIVTDDTAFWERSPEKNEAGTPNLMGAVALASAIKTIERIGINKIEEYEEKLTEYLLLKLQKLNRVKIYGYPDANFEKRTSVVAFEIKDVHHSLVAAILSHEYGIGVRSGCFCAHPYVLRLLNVGQADIESYKEEVLKGDKSRLPGLVRVSLGIYNTFEDIDRLILALQNICNGNYLNSYIFDKKSGSYMFEKFTFCYRNLFEF